MSDNSLESEDLSRDIPSCECTNEAKIKSSAKKQKRPDKQLYIPPGSKSTKSPDLDCQHQTKPDKNEPSWDSLYDDNGDVIDDEFVNDLNSELGVKTISNQLASSKLDYSKFCDLSLSDESATECGNILEVYDFPADLKTRDLISSLSASNSKHFDIDWVDDTHALIIFSTPLQATEALNKVYPNLKLRALAQGSKESQLKAKKKSENRIPRKPRPETTTFLARRLVAGALGIKADMDPEQRKAEREKLRLAKEKKKQVLKQVKNIWEGNVS